MKISKTLFFLLALLVHSSLYADVIFSIKGIDNKDVKENIVVFLKGLSQPQNANSQSYLQQVQSSTRQAVTALGYYQMKLDINVTGEAGKQTVTLLVNLGMATRITALNLKLLGEGSSDPDFLKIVKNFPLKKNDILHHGKYEQGKNQLKNMAQQHGYFDAKFSQASVDVISKNNSATVNIRFDTGIRYQFGELFFSPEDLPAKKLISSLQNFKAGDPYDSQTLMKFNTETNRTGYFKNISIVPEIKKKQGREIPLLVLAKMRPKDSFNAGIGVSTDEGIRGKFRWTRPWVNQYGHSIVGNVVASVPRQEASLAYNIPISDPLYHYYSIKTGYKFVDDNDTNTQQYLFSVGRYKRLENNWLRNVFVKYHNETGEQGQDDFSAELIMPGVSFSRIRLRGGLHPTWGDTQQYEIAVAHKSLFSSSNLFKIYGKAKFLRSYNKQQFFSTTEVGALYTDSIYNVPASMRFFAGGDQSIRGYSYESISPEDNDGYLIGGKYLAVQSLEYRFPVANNWKVATFIDAGTATSTFSEPISVGAGLGIIWSSPIGPVRFYAAAPVNNADTTLNKWMLHFMIGPEL
ncbi:surface antigen (D15) [Psychromonas ingrahamii 37]|uniref:Translocation and assembly module subunit TamA n=1 Tax=Psychromonas ingrahamii (strain DSM 17664 / CCUG 51855 / 37) TaxID=357804 RepID=A1SW22_PSYIN|nr:autotransporter assembly complex family protein [Psychromonas ingrahamii]ABM03687.1 surface antigen (D15) [Psychromonas ingrahamii 37]